MIVDLQHLPTFASDSLVVETAALIISLTGERPGRAHLPLLKAVSAVEHLGPPEGWEVLTNEDASSLVLAGDPHPIRQTACIEHSGPLTVLLLGDPSLGTEWIDSRPWPGTTRHLLTFRMDPDPRPIGRLQSLDLWMGRLPSVPASGLRSS